MDGIALVMRYVTGIHPLVTSCDGWVARDGTKFGNMAMFDMVPMSRITNPESAPATIVGAWNEWVHHLATNSRLFRRKKRRSSSGDEFD